MVVLITVKELGESQKEQRTLIRMKQITGLGFRV